MGIVGDGGELCDGARPRRGLRLEAHAEGKFGVQAKGAKDLPTLALRGEVEDVRVTALRDSQMNRISRQG